LQYLERHVESIDWITLTLVGCFLVLAFAKYLYPFRFQEFIRLPITNKYFLVQGKNEEIQHPFNLLLFAIQAVSVSLFIYLIFELYNPETIQNNEWLFIQICTGYIVFVFIKFCIEKIVGSIFSIDKLVNSYLYQKITYRNLISIFIFISNLVFFYIFRFSETILLVYIIVFLTLNTITLVYSYKTHGNLVSRHFLYFILYLCALEISPYIILYKVFI